MRPFLILSLLCVGAAACHLPPRSGNPPPSRDPARVPPTVAHDTALEQHAARLELKVLEQEAQVEELQNRLDDAPPEVRRAMAKLQSLATRAEAPSGAAQAGNTRQGLR